MHSPAESPSNPSVLPNTIWRAYLIAGACGMAVMIAELVASRVLAPYLGTSIIVWTSLIGVIMACLAVGYWLGGRVADREASFRGLAFITSLASLLLSLSVGLQLLWLPGISQSGNPYLQSVLVTAVLFGPAGVVLAMVSPYTARLLMRGLDGAGATVGRVSAFSTAGSILGTFLTGFVLVGWLGSTVILIGLAGLLWLLSLIASPRGLPALRLIGLALIGAVALLANASGAAERMSGIRTSDTQYSHVQVIDQRVAGRPVRSLVMGRVTHSSMYLDYPSEIVHDYIAAYQLTDDLLPNPKQALMLGGAAFTYPRVFLANHPDASATVVEIDPGIVEVARREFGLKDQPGLNIVVEDGRRYLNQAVERGERYDVVVGDAFGSAYSVPFELTTKEAAEQVRSLLTDDGLYVVNIIASEEGPGAQLLEAYCATLASVFPQVEWFPLGTGAPESARNVIVLARMRPGGTPPAGYGKVPQVWSVRRDVRPSRLPILTDQYAPVDRYLLPLVGGV